MMIVSEPQRARIQLALLKIIQTETEFASLLVSLGRNLDALSATGRTYAQRLRDVIDVAVDDRWLPPLLAQARAKAPGDTTLEGLERELRAVMPPPGRDATEMCQLVGQHVMLDRAQLRAALRQLQAPNGKRILIVTGKRKSGKSHSVQLMAYVRDSVGGFDLAWVDLERMALSAGTGTVIDPRMLAEKLVRLMRCNTPPDAVPTDGQWPRWVQNFGDSLESELQSNGKTWWVAIDGFGKVVLHQATLDLVIDLAMRVNRTLSKVRLVLLGYEEKLPPDVGPNVEKDEIGPISPEWIIEFFLKAFEERGVQASDDVVENAARRLLEQVDVMSQDFLTRFADLASAELSRPNGGA